MKEGGIGKRIIKAYLLGTGNIVPRHESWARDSFNLYRKPSSEISSPVPRHDLVLKSCHRCWRCLDIDQWCNKRWWCRNATQWCYSWCSNKTNDFTYDVMFWSRPTKAQTMMLRYQSTMLNSDQLCYRWRWYLNLINDVTHDNDVSILFNDATDNDNVLITSPGQENENKVQKTLTRSVRKLFWKMAKIVKFFVPTSNGSKTGPGAPISMIF